MPSLNKNLFYFKNLITTKKDSAPTNSPATASPEAVHTPAEPASPPRSRSTYPTPSPSPQRGGELFAHFQTIEQTTTQNKTPPPRHGHPKTAQGQPQYRPTQKQGEKEDDTTDRPSRGRQPRARSHLFLTALSSFKADVRLKAGCGPSALDEAPLRSASYPTPQFRSPPLPKTPPQSR